MILNDSSEIIHFKYQDLSQKDIQQLYLPIDSMDSEEILKHIIKIDDKFYYSKICKSKELINELIGTYLCKLIGLDVVDYKIGRTESYSSYYYALSEVFYKPGFFYPSVLDYYDMRPDDQGVYEDDIEEKIMCDTCVVDLIKSPQLISSIMKMTAVDLKMGQIDRHIYNVVLRCLMNGDVELEKLFDFGGSYDDDPPYPEFYCYDNPFLIVRKNTLSLMNLARRYPQISESAAKLSTTPLFDVIKEIEKKFNIKIEDKDIPGYLEMDNEYNRILRKLR